MTPEQREKKNNRLREWRKGKRRDDPEWAKRQAEYSKQYARKRRNDGTQFDDKRRKVGRDYYHRLVQAAEGREKVREASLRAYRKRVQDEESRLKLRQQQREHARKRKKSDPEFAIKSHLRARLADLVRASRCKRNKSAIELTGASISELCRHLEKQFKRGMSWGNYGDWHIDHIIPCSKFDLTDPRQQSVCFNYLNLRPCWAAENIRKGNRLIAPAQLPLGI